MCKKELEPLPSPEELKKTFPLGEKEKAFISSYRHTVENIYLHKDPRLLLIVGPCSIHSPQLALDYATKLKELQKKVEKHFFILLRAYVEKPRTKIGWKGFLYDPNLDGSNQLNRGLVQSRNLFLELASREIPLAMEIVDPLITPYMNDLLTWGCIGARTASSQTHRQIASSLPFPIGFKNTIEGSIETAVQGAESARAPHSFFTLDEKGKISTTTSYGNPFSHIVLRGSKTKANYSQLSIQYALEVLQKYKLDSPLLVDCSHGNCGKDPTKQKQAFISVIEQIREGNKKIMGLMLESNLKEGSQPLGEDPSSLLYGVSITDPCISWETTEELILWAAQTLSPVSL